MCWKIMGSGVPTLRIHADSFDEAIRKARAVDDRYCAGCVDEED